MKRINTLLLLLLTVPFLVGMTKENDEELTRKFIDPPASAKPQVWWHWMNGNVTREGITADLEAMANVGLGGGILFDAGLGTRWGVPEGTLTFNTPEWYEMVKFAATEAQRLGLELGIANCSGWANSGGPWNTPEYAMKRVVYTETELKGGVQNSIKLDLTYCDVANLYGADEAVKRWDRFYALAVQAGLHEKVVLEGMSRGGLIIYNWAAANVEKVACIYADAPVMDFKSWPMGKGTAPRSEVDTKRLLSAYGFRSEEEALQWGGNPIDHAAILAKAGIPMLHVVGEEDKVVPVSENTALFAKRLAAYHYKLNVINKPGIGHHPHSLNNPEPIVRFILRATGLPNPPSVHPVPGNETVNEAL